MKIKPHTLLWRALCGILLWLPGAFAADAAPRTAAAPTASYDYIIRYGLVYDGSGSPPRIADVAIKDQKIAAIGILPHHSATKEIDATGLAVSPGFIDLHYHLEALHRLPGAANAVAQGVTTALGGPDGNSPLPLASHLKELELTPLGINVGFLVGHGAVRLQTLKLANRPPSPSELETMRELVAQAMKDGAFGLSTGLKYVPGTFARTDEIIALARVAGAAGGIYTTHLREEGVELIPAVKEAIEIGRQAGIPVHLTHHKVVGLPSWGASSLTLQLVDQAVADGQDVTLDQYPYTASNTNISILIPSWALAGGREAFRARMGDPAERARARAEIVHAILTDRGGGDIDRVQFTAVAWRPELEGKTLRAWCLERGLPPTPENGADLVIEAELAGGCLCIFHAMSDEDVDRIMQHPRTMIASDAYLVQHGEISPHPRVYGTFPRVLGHYSRDRKLFPLETAIHKMTQLPAHRLGLRDRGTLTVGMFADIVIFDPETVIDRATYQSPHQFPQGIRFVFVNGVVALENGLPTAARGGQVLRHITPPAGAEHAN